MKIRQTTGKKARIEMLPLIDIVFLVLVVFIYAMLSMAVHRGLPVTLPQSASTAPEQATELTVNIQADGAVFVNRQAVAGAQLTDHLRLLAAEQPDAAVILFADRDLSYQQLFTVLDKISAAGLERVSLQAEAATP
ncbi:ExbD/TolR family protein [Desulfurivibrio alkaliphilus]|uniref:Biopolymer transport protein ExbD/TolR n=1 Tax=Desulfurivibrio alkaliphilus (strain DSM 19089 / UNIQEM U267 / AHT2) TaxID=589865 RepID=D6Z3X6_DESAT|nr:biopolymer transporter ExbD [Desulfurivibrio alkaliphilus]ADH86251.1 Biopolymer transport protein ExbD/TolR [Desulfurivibrio alkaliphilus AHT 2]